MAESELGVHSAQCLDRRIPDKPKLIEEVAAWQANRNEHHAQADWQFTTADARILLKLPFYRSAIRPLSEAKVAHVFWIMPA